MASGSGPSVPTYIFTCRHGHRLDAADPNWQYSSPTPYDPPITYGGWLQGRSLGLRIASNLYPPAAPAPSSTNLDNKITTAKKQRKKTRVIIHTSPFLRCIQTSIAISAGIAQFDHELNVTNCAANGSGNGPTVAADEASDGNNDSGDVLAQREKYIKPLLRIDCWLGEWLTPDYYTEISPPPETSVLAAFAKNDLMRPSSAGAIRGSSSSRPSPLTPLTPLTPLNTVSELGNVLPGYVPPKPSWAISSNAPIPRGYISHARDYIETDFGWDSLKFGNGGEYGEDWTSMHKRFRKGYKNVLMWYATNDAEVTAFRTTWNSPKRSLTSASVDGSSSSGTPTTVMSEEQLAVANSETEAGSNNFTSAPATASTAQEATSIDEPEFETVVIFVTHGAGCNALIGAITDKPVLVDISIASLTMAIKQNKPPSPKLPLRTSFSSGIIPPPRPPSLHDMPFSYDVKIMASTEHLRKGSMAAVMGGTPQAGNSPSLAAFRSQFTGSNITLPEPGMHTKSGSLVAQGTPNFVIRGGTGGGTRSRNHSDNNSNASSIISSGGSDASSSPSSLKARGAEMASSIPGPHGVRRSATISSGVTGLWTKPLAMIAPDPVSESSSPRSSTSSISGLFRDREREGRHRETSRSRRRDNISGWHNASESAVASGSEESDENENGNGDKPRPGLWSERKRRWTVDRAGGRRGSMNLGLGHGKTNNNGGVDGNGQQPLLGAKETGIGAGILPADEQQIGS